MVKTNINGLIVDNIQYYLHDVRSGHVLTVKAHALD